MSLDTAVISTSHRPSAVVIDGDEVARFMTSGDARSQVARVAAAHRSAS